MNLLQRDKSALTVMVKSDLQACKLSDHQVNECSSIRPLESLSYEETTLPSLLVLSSNATSFADLF